MSTTIGCPIPGTSQPKEPVRLIDADELKKRAVKVCFPDTPECGEFDAVGTGDIDIMPTIGPESLRPTAHWISDSAEAQMLYVQHVMQFLSLLIIFARSAEKGW